MLPEPDSITARLTRVEIFTYINTTLILVILAAMLI